MAGPVLSNADYGSPTYTDDSDNWRAQDVVYIQRRSVLRFPTQAALEANSHNQFGAVAYVAVDADADDDIEPGAEPYFTGNTGRNGAAAWRRFMHSQYLRIPEANDTDTSVRVRHSAASSGLSLRSTGAVLAETRLEVGSGSTQSALDPNLLSLQNGANTRTVQVNGSGQLAVNGTVAVTGVVSSGGISATTITATGLVETGSVNVSGNLTATGTIGSTTGNLTTVNSTTVNSTTFASGSVRLTSTGVSRVDGASVSLSLNSNSELAVLATGGFTFRTASSGQTAAQVAGLVVSTSPPSGTYPPGTIWAQVAGA
jgi:hypothetical protein